MERVVVAVLMVVVVGCQVEFVPEADPCRFREVEEVSVWVYANVEYVSDMDKWGRGDVWQSPSVTYEDGSGDCEDFCILFLYLCYRDFGIKGWMYGVEDDEGRRHAVAAVYQGGGRRVYDVSSGRIGFKEEWSVERYYSFSKIFRKVEWDAR
jgi:predicted transglutaminase-like cysteine proteinase